MEISLNKYKVKKEKGLFLFEPEKMRLIRLDNVLEQIHFHHIITTVESDDFFIAHFQGAKITFFRSGRIKVADAKTAEKAKSIVKKFLKKIT